MKEIIPLRMVLTLGEQGEVTDAIMTYKMRIDGSMDTRKIYSVNVRPSFEKQVMDAVGSVAKAHSEFSEGMITADALEDKKGDLKNGLGQIKAVKRG